MSNEFDFKEFNKWFDRNHDLVAPGVRLTTLMRDYDKDVMARVKDEVHGAVRWHEAQYHADKPLTEAHALKIVRAELDDHTDAFHDVPDDILHDKPDAKPQGVQERTQQSGVYVEPGDRLLDSGNNNQSAASRVIVVGPTEKSDEIVCAWGYNHGDGKIVTLCSELKIKGLTLDGLPVLGVR